MRAGETDAGRRELDAVLATAKESERPAAEQAERLREYLGLVWKHVPSERAELLALARRELERLRLLAPAGDAERGRVETWLAEHDTASPG